MNNYKRILSLILALILTLSTFTPVFAQTKTPVKKTRTGAQEVQIGDEIYYIFSTDKNAKDDLIKSQEKSEKKTQAIQTSDGLNLSDNLFGRPVGAGRPASYTLNIKGNNFKGVGGKTFDWDTLPEGFELQVFYIDENYIDVNIGNPITINESNYQDAITRTFDLAEQPLGFGFKTNVDTDTYLTDAYLTNESAPEPGVGSLDMTFDLVQVPSTKLDVKWVDVNQQPLARENMPATSLKDILTFNFIENKKFELPNQDKVDSYFRLNNKIGREEVKDMQGATALVDSKRDGEEVTLDGKIYKLTTSYDPALNKGSKIQLMYMPDVIDRTKNPESPTPDKYVRVTIDAGEGTKLAQGQTKKVYDVRIGKVLKAEHYPKLEISDSAKYKDPITWTIAPETAITKAENIKGNAAKTAAETITAANLKAVDTTALQGQDFPEKFWNDGVALADNTPADKKDAFAALLKDATVTDITNPTRTTAEAGDKVGTLLVTFKDGSKLEVPNQKLIVKPNTVTVAFDKAAGKEHPLRDGDTTVKGKITASSNSVKFPVSLDGAVVTIKKGDTVLTRTLANADGSFVAGVKDKLIAGEDISVVVTLPESKTASAPVTEKVQLNPDKLNSIIPTGQEVVKNLKGKKGVDQAKVTKLEEAITKAFTLVDKGTSAEDQMKKLPKATVTVDATGQKSLDDQYEAIKKAIAALTGNTAPEITGTSHKEIFKGDALNLEEGITVTDVDGETDIDKTGGKAFTYAVQKVDAKGNKAPVTDASTINKTAGTYEVTYTAKDKSGAEGTFVMTLVVKEPVVEIKDNFPEVIPEGYVKVEFKEGAHGTLEGTTKFLVKDGSANTVLNAPTIKPNANYEAKKGANWDPAIPETFTGTEENKKSFVFTAQYTYIGKDVVEQKPGDKKPDVPDNFVKVEFKKGDHGVISSEETTIYWVNPEKEVTLTAPTVTPSHGYKHTGWNPEVKANTKYTEAKEFVAQYKATVVTEDPNDAEHYAKVDFAAGDQGKFEQVGGKDQVTTFWVWKGEKVSFNAPKVTANENYKFKEWDKPIQETYDADTTHTATYESTLNISDKEVKGYQEVKFVSGTDGNFGKDGETPITTKSVWVKPDTLVDLRSKAPTVTVTAEKKSFVGWDKDLVGEFAKADQPTVINAEYDATVKTEKPTKHADKFVKVDFSAGNLGTIADDATKTFWVVKGEKVTDTFKAPTVKPVKDWKVKDDKAAWSPEVAETYDKDTIHVAQYDYTGGGLVEQKPGDPKPNVPDKFKRIEFKPGDHGIISSEETTIFWADPTKAVKLTPPKVIANTGYVHDAWDPAVPTEATKFTEAKTYTATYKNDEGISETPKPGYIAITFDAGENGRINGNKTKTVYANPEMEVTLTAPEVTPNPGYLNDGWDPVIPGATKFTQPTTYTAKYKDDEDISKTEKPGYIPVTFDAGLNGTIEGKRTSTVYVNPAKAVKVTAPALVANAGYTFDKWDPAIPADAKQYTTPAIYIANYTKGADISETEVKGFIKVSFNAGEHGNFGMTTTQPAKEILSKDLYIRPNTPVDLTNYAPKVTPKTGWLVNGWSRSLVIEVNDQTQEKDKTITAQYVADTSVSETEKPGYTKITFKAGQHGNFGVDGSTPVTEKNLWLNPEADVKLSEKAPKTIDDINWSFDKWMDGQNPATGLDVAGKYTEAKTFTASYKSDISTTPQEGFVEVKFVAGEHGKFEQVNGKDQVTTIYVRKDKEIDITVKEPKVTPDNGYYFTGWDKPLQKVYTEDTTHTGKNTNAIADQAVEGWTQITFNAGDKGLFKPDAKTVLWVKPGTKVALDKQVPGLEIEKGYSCIGWKKDAETNVTDLKVPATYDKSTTFTAAYESDFSKDNKEGFIEIKFKAGDNGNFGKTTGTSSTEVKDYSLWVRPDKEVDLTDQAPKVYPNVGWKLNGWDKTLTITVNAQTAEADRTFTAQYLKDDDVSDTKKEGYIEITFNAGDHGTFPSDAKTVKYVNPDSEIALSTIAPTVNPAINYSFKAWNNGTADVALDAKIKYTQATNYRATYESDISDTPKNGFVEVKFAAGTDGEFKQVNGVDQKTTFYVKKDKLVDLSDVAPIATGKDKKTFTGWDSDLKRTFTDALTTINAKYTESISDKYVPGWTQLDFDQGDHGRFVKGQKNVKWVDPAVDLKLEDIAPKIKADPNWTFKAWNDGAKDVDGTKAQKFTKATTFTATYEDAFSPGAKEGFVKVTFDQGAHGKFVKEAVKEIYVKKDVDLDLREKAPTVIPNQGWGHKGWTINNAANDLTKVTVSGETTITADYAEGTFDATKITKIVVLGPTQMGYGVGEKLNLDGLKVIAIDDAGLQETYDGVAKIEEKGFTIEPADKTELKMADNGKHIVVTKGEGQDKVTGQTETTLTIHENKSAKAENVKALNQNKVVDGKVTNDPKDTTTVTGKAKAGSTVIIKDEAGNEIGKVEKVGNDGTFTAEVTKQAEGKKVKVVVTEEGKQPSDPADATVVRDADNNGVADKKEQFDIKKATKVEIIKNPDKMKYSVTEKTGKTPFDATGVIIRLTDGSGKTATYTYADITSEANKGKFTLSPADKEQIGLKEDGSVNTIPFKVTVTGADTKPSVTAEENITVILDKDNNGVDDRTEQTPEPTVTARNIGTDGPDGKKVPATKTTVEIKTEPKAKVTIEYTDKDGQSKKIENLTAGEDGKLTQEITPKLDKDTPVKVTVQDGEKQPTAKTVKVFDDLDDNKIPDNQAGKTERPAAIASNKGKTPEFTTIVGKTEPGAVITVKVKDGNAEKAVDVKEFKIDADGNYTLQATVGGQPLKNGAEILVYAENAPKTISKPQTTTVFNDFNEDGKPDGGKVDLNKIQDIQVIDPNKMTYVEGTDGQLNLAGLKVVVRDTVEGIQIFEYDTNANKFKDGDTVVDGFTVKVEDKAVQQNTDLTSAEHNNKKITVAYGEKSGETVQALKVTKTLPAPEVDPVKKGDKTVNVTVPNNGETKITVKVGDKEVIVEKDPKDSQWKVGNNPVDTVKGKLQIPVDELKQGDVVKVTTEDPAGNQGQAEKQVPVDKYSAKPTDLKAKNEPATPNKTTVTGKATPGATITIKDKNGNVLTTEPTPVTAGQDGTFKATIDKKDPNTLLLVTAKEEGKEPSGDVPVQVEGSSDVVEKKPGDTKPDGFVEVRFVINDGDKAKGSLEGAKEFYVNPKVEVALNPPVVNPATGYKLDGWLLAGKATNLAEAKQYTEAMATEIDSTDGKTKYIKITAKFAEEPDVVPGKDPNTGKDNEKPAGYVEIEFAVDGSKGKFADNAETKFFVNPKKDVKLTAPGVTVTDLAYTMDGWDNANWNGTDFDTAKYTSDTLISAKFKGSYVAPPKVDDVVTGETTVNVNPGDADKVTVVVEGQKPVEVKKDPNDGDKWKTPDGTVVTPDADGKLPVPVQPIGEKALVEVTVEKDGVESEKVVKTAQKRIGLTVSNMEENKNSIIVQTYPAGAKVTISLKGEVLVENTTDFLGILTAILKNPKKAGEIYTIKAEMDGYISEELTLPVLVK